MKTRRHPDSGSYAKVGGTIVRVLICDDDAAFAQDMAQRILALPEYSAKSMSVDCLTDLAAMNSAALVKYDISGH